MEGVYFMALADVGSSTTICESTRFKGLGVDVVVVVVVVDGVVLALSVDTAAGVFFVALAQL